ncbi:phosphate acyltransferase, partial [Staphylococcus epidermidis]|uniref:phosphate acyltransferase n=1 Tax=Staphylococcus epidermidis TaxID=1282 RepID=UPI0021B17AE2
LRFCRKGCGKWDDVSKVEEGLKLGEEKGEGDELDDVVIDGELEFEGGIVGRVGEKKGGGGKIEGDGNVFVLASLEV